MRLVIVSSLVALFAGCADSQEVWQLEVVQSPGVSCDIDGATLILAHDGDDDFANTASEPGRQMRVANTPNGFDVTIEVHNEYHDVVFEASVRRTPRPGEWPALLEGSVTVRGDHCNGSFAMKGIGQDVEDWYQSTLSTPCPAADSCPVTWWFD